MGFLFKWLGFQIDFIGCHIQSPLRRIQSVARPVTEPHYLAPGCFLADCQYDSAAESPASSSPLRWCPWPHCFCWFRWFSPYHKSISVSGRRLPLRSSYDTATCTVPAQWVLVSSVVCRWLLSAGMGLQPITPVSRVHCQLRWTGFRCAARSGEMWGATFMCAWVRGSLHQCSSAPPHCHLFIVDFDSAV